MLTFSGASAVGVAKEVSDKLPDSLSQTAVLLYQVLIAIAVEKAHKESYSPGVTHITFHSSLEGLARTCGMSRMTAYRQLAKLKELGVIDYRPQVKTLWGASRHTGCVFQVRLNPTEGSRCRLSYSDLKHDYRGNFGAQVKAGRTSYRMLKAKVLHTKNLEINLVNFQMLVQWSLQVFTHSEPVADVCNTGRQVGLEAVLDVVYAAKEQRGAAVDLGAKALAQALRDTSSLDWYRKLLWQCLRRIDTTGQDHTYAVYLAAQRAKTDVLERFARRGGAVFNARLKQAAWFEEVLNAPPVRVGMKPAA